MFIKFRYGFTLLMQSFRYYGLIKTLGQVDIRQRYSRSIIGPFWLTISAAIMIATLGLVFGNVFSIESNLYLPHMAIGIVLWNFISAIVLEGCTSIISAQSLLKQLPIPFVVFSMRIIYRNLIILMHNAIIIIFIMAYYNVNIGGEILLFIPAFIILNINLLWISFFLAIISTRFRDVPQILQSFMQVLFYLTPIVWLPQLMTGRYGEIVLFVNPIYHLIEIVRIPLLGGVVNLLVWCYVTVFTLIGITVTIYLYGKHNDEISYWI